jgi:dienelactone hydrolase
MKRRDLLLAGSGLATIITVGASDTIATTPKSSGQSPRKGQRVKLDANLSGYYAVPTGTKPAPAVIVIMEAFGLNENIKGVCDRLAENGFAALAPDIYHGAIFPSYILAEEHKRIALALSKAKKQYSLNVFAGAGHGFLSDRRDSYHKPAAAEAWAMTLSFFNRHLGTGDQP